MSSLFSSYTPINLDIESGIGCTVYDKSGTKFLDLESGLWSTSLGHNNPKVNDAITQQLGKITHVNTRMPSHVAEQAAQNLAAASGMLDAKCTFLCSGSEAMELAVAIARYLLGEKKLLTFSNSYLSAFGHAGEKNRSDFLLFDWEKSGFDNPDSALETIDFDKVGGFIFEPGGSGTGFVRFPPSELVKKISQRIRENHGMIICNEVTTGIGRTGKFFGFQHYDIEPDLISMGKGLGNGYPVSAVVLKREVARKLEEEDYTYIQSHQNDPLGCCVVNAVLSTLSEDRLVQRSQEIGAYFLGGLRNLVNRYGFVNSARGRGLLLALEFAPNEQMTASLMQKTLQKRGYLVGCYPAANILRFDPALTITTKEVDSFLNCLDTVFKEAIL
ncbi:MAG: aspartate aminotransferase family protein [Pseudohaliea sp.]